MKKHVPDPPPVLCINPGVTHDEAVRNAADFLKKALDKTSPVSYTHLTLPTICSV